MSTYAKIDYGYGTAHLYGNFDSDTVKRYFMKYANQCFGIRKSIAKVEVLELKTCELPEPWALFPDVKTILKHNGDVIVWNSTDDKIKSEWD